MKYIYISIFFILNLFISNTVIADQSVIKELQRGGKIVFIRHSLAPGNGDPDNIDLKKCDTQRNLNQEGIEHQKKLENYLKTITLKLTKFYLVNGVDAKILQDLLLINMKHSRG